MKISKPEVRDWLFRGLMFEADAEQFRSAGIRVGADIFEAERNLLEETLRPFSIEMRNEALEMGRLYTLLYCFENSVRNLIRERLQETYGSNWWADKVPKKIKDFAETRQKDAMENSWLEGQKRDLFGFIQFGHLSDIIVANWEDFSDLVPTQHWIKQRMDELEQTRNYVAHNRLLLPGEFQRIERYVNDWNRMVGL